MAEQLSEDDIKFFLSLDPDEESVRKAVEQINADIEHANVKKVKLGIEKDSRYVEAGKKADQFAEFFKGLFGGGKKGAAPPAAGGAGAGTAAAAEGAAGAGAGASGGAAAGAAKGLGKAGAIVAAVLKGAEIAGKAAATSLRLFNTGLTAMAGALRDMQGPLGGIGAGLNIVSQAFGGMVEGLKKMPVLGQLLGPMMEQLAKMPAILGEILSTGLNFASKANPGVLKQLSIAMEDAMATIGQAFIPVVEEMVPVIREIGTAIAQALPSNEEMREMFRGLFESIKELVKELAPLIGPMLKGLVSIVKSMVSVLTAVVRAFKFVYDMLRKIPIVGRFLPDISGKGGDEKRGPIAAARTPWMGSIEEFQRRLQMQTAHGPRAMGPESVPNNVGKVAASVENIEKWFQKMDPAAWKEIVKAGGDRSNDTRGLVNAAEMGLG